MTSVDFIKEIEKFYGPYENAHRRSVICVWLEDNFTEQDLKKLYKVTLEGFSTQYGKVPDIAVFKELVYKYNKANGEWYRYAGGQIEFLGEGIGVGAGEKELLTDGRKQIENGQEPTGTVSGAAGYRQEDA